MPFNSSGFFGGNKGTQVRPVALEITFSQDMTGSEDDYLTFTGNPSFPISLENALKSEGVGAFEIPNRYSACAFHCEAAQKNNQRWLTGPQLAGSWRGVTPERNDNPPQKIGGDFRFRNSGKVDSSTRKEDQTGGGLQAASNYDRNRQFRFEIPKILISSSNEQDWYNNNSSEAPLLTLAQEFEDSMLGVNDPRFAHTFVGFGNIWIDVDEAIAGTANPPPDPRPAGIVVGVIFPDPAICIAIYRNGSDYQYRRGLPISSLVVNRGEMTFDSQRPDLFPPNPPPAEGVIVGNVYYRLAQFLTEPTRITQLDPIVFPRSSPLPEFQEQRCNIFRLAYNTRGAMYSSWALNNNQRGFEIFGESLGLVLGRLLWEGSNPNIPAPTAARNRRVPLPLLAHHL